MSRTQGKVSFGI